MPIKTRPRKPGATRTKPVLSSVEACPELAEACPELVEGGARLRGLNAKAYFEQPDLVSETI